MKNEWMIGNVYLKVNVFFFLFPPLALGILETPTKVRF